jgi:hypothetical protein
MRLTGKDAVTTLSTVAIIAVYVAYLRGMDLPLIVGVRGTAAAILVLGTVGGCALSEAGDLYAGTQPLRTRIFTVLASTTGATALVAGLTGMITGSEYALAVLFAATVALWFMATLRHALTGPCQAPGSPDHPREKAAR